MRYSFPENLTTEEVRRVIHRHNERTGTKAFIEADRGDHVVFNYIVQFDGSFPQPNTRDEALNREYAILRECRGLIMCPQSGRVLARRYHKFFNLGERDETLLQNIDFDQPHVILEKLDGSMITPFRTSVGLFWGTKMGATDVAKPVVAHVAANPQYITMAHDLIDKGLTPIFEWCSRQQRIVIDYPLDQLVLTAVRDNGSGRYLSYENLLAYGQQYGVPVVRALPGSVENIEQFMAEARDLTGAEGYVFRFANGHMGKVKGAEYLQLHKTKEMLQFEKDVWSLILHDKLDDAKAFMNADDRGRVDAFAQAFETGVNATADRLNWVVIAARDNLHGSKKRFAVEVVSQPEVPKQEKGLLFSIWDGGDPVKVVRDYLKTNVGTQTKVNAVRSLVGGVNWSDYRGEVVDLDA